MRRGGNTKKVKKGIKNASKKFASSLTQGQVKRNDEWCRGEEEEAVVAAAAVVVVVVVVEKEWHRAEKNSARSFQTSLVVHNVGYPYKNICMYVCVYVYTMRDIQW